MKKIALLLSIVMIMSSCGSSGTKENDSKTIDKSLLRDKIAGGWAGKIIGVTYGAPTEFKAQGKTYEDPITWKPADVRGSLWQDDIYVQITFMETMDQFGIDAPAEKFHELFAKAGYHLWHANVQARKNYFDGILPPLSGHPDYSTHADDIDFQIEADYIGFINPGMPQSASKIADKIGHIMNYGDGVYGGVFVAALYTEAYFENSIPKIIDKALLSIPEESDYAKIVRDVVILHKQYPSDWRKAWQELENKWGKVQICEAGTTFNIDAKLNGAYIVMGLLYGEGDIDKTMEISTRCGQDSDCNPSNAVAVLGIINGFSSFPKDYQDAIMAIKDSLYIHTSYSFSKAVDQSMKYAEELTIRNGGTVNEKSLKIKIQEPVAMAMEDAFPKTVIDKRVNVVSQHKEGWAMKGKWAVTDDKRFVYSGTAGDELSFTFEGTGITLDGCWVKDGGMADVYIDGELKRTINCYYYYARQQHRGISIYHIFNLPPGKHTLKLVVKDQKHPDSEGNNIYVSEALVFKTGKKINEDFKFSFQ
jgi:ADP-ribosylglycohydrolase.